MKILIADDDALTIKILSRYLKEWNYDVVSAVDGKIAWDILKDDPEISMLITDWLMPEMDGVELCKKIREFKFDHFIPIILLTSRSDKEDLLSALEAGADAFIVKPLNPLELKSQIKVAERVLNLETKLKGQLKRLNEAHVQLEEAHFRLRKNLESAAAIQKTLLPSKPPNIKTARFSWAFEASEMVAWDMFNVIQLDDENIGIYILDVSGHGVQAALLSVSISRILTPYPQHGGILRTHSHTTHKYEIISPKKVMESLNMQFPVMLQSHQFFTILYGILNLGKNEFRYVRAGHPLPILISDKKIISLEDEGGLPIGIVEKTEYDESMIKLNKGDKLIFHSDGLNEAENAEREQFGMEKIFKCLESNFDSSIATAIQSLHSEAVNFRGDKPQNDDITMVGIEII